MLLGNSLSSGFSHIELQVQRWWCCILTLCIWSIFQALQHILDNQWNGFIHWKHTLYCPVLAAWDQWQTKNRLVLRFSWHWWTLPHGWEMSLSRHLVNDWLETTSAFGLHSYWVCDSLLTDYHFSHLDHFVRLRQIATLVIWAIFWGFVSFLLSTLYTRMSCNWQHFIVDSLYSLKIIVTSLITSQYNLSWC